MIGAAELTSERCRAEDERAYQACPHDVVDAES